MIFLTAACSLSLICGIANASETRAMHKMDPVCKPAWEHFKKNQPEIRKAIEANDANRVGTLVIADHNYMKNFLAKHPQCEPKKKWHHN